MNIRHHNFGYDGGSPNLPHALGDRYYSQDQVRDFWHGLDYSSRAAAIAGRDPGFLDTESFPVHLAGMITKGTGDTLNLPVVRGIHWVSARVPDSFAALPPTSKLVDVVGWVEAPAQTDMALPAATLDGVATNYIKLRMKENDGASRNRAKKAGSYAYEREFSYEYVVSTVAPTRYEVVLGTLVGTGGGAFTIVHYVPADPCFIAVAGSTASEKRWANFVLSATEDVGKLVMDLRASGVRSVLLASGTFRQSTSIYLSTTDSMVFRGAGSKLTTLDLNGAEFTSIRLPASYAGKFKAEGFTVDASGRTVSAAIPVIDGASWSYDQSWHDVWVDISSSTAGGYTSLSAIANCNNLYDGGYIADSVDASILSFGVSGCHNLHGLICLVNNCTSQGMVSASEGLYGVRIKATNLPSGTSTYGFNGCSRMFACSYSGDGTGHSSNSYAYSSCTYLSGCEASHSAAIGFSLCEYMSNCYAIICHNDGYNTCLYLTSCFAQNNLFRGFGQCRHVIACYSTGNTNYGFGGCQQCQQNYSTGNTAGQYNTSFADVSTNACANTAAGGYNK